MPELRLVTETDGGHTTGNTNAVTIRLEIVVNGAQIPLTQYLARCQDASMSIERAHAPAPASIPFPGKIAQDAPAEPLSVALDGWGRHLTAKGCVKSSVTRMRGVIERGAKAEGWATATDLTFEAVTGYLGRARESGGWKGTTYTCSLSAFKSFARWCKQTKRIKENDIQDAEKAWDDGDEGARAATTDEARAMLKASWLRHSTDKRSRGNRPLYWAMLFLAGMRASEPAALCWKHIMLDDEHPCIRWTKDIQKNGKQAEIVLHPELAALLRQHRETVPNAAENKVFPIVPPRNTFREDRDRGGVRSIDSRGRGFSCHSARKWFKTTLASAGVPDSMVDFLMRHTGSTEARYMDPPTNAQLSALQKLPSIWPENLKLSVDWCQTNAETYSIGQDDRVFDQTDPYIESSGHPDTVSCGPQDSTTAFQPGNGHYRVENGGLNPELADLLEAIARVLRKGASHVERIPPTAQHRTPAANPRQQNRKGRAG